MCLKVIGLFATGTRIYNPFLKTYIVQCKHYEHKNYINVSILVFLYLAADLILKISEKDGRLLLLPIAQMTPLYYYVYLV